MNIRLAFEILRSILSGNGDVTISADGDAVLADSAPVSGTAECLSERGVVARIQRLARRAGLPILHVPMLVETWEEEFASHPHVSASRLMELARRCVAAKAVGTGPLVPWRQALESRLQDAYPDMERVERFAPVTRLDVRQRTLELAPMLDDWPSRLLTHRQWAYAESPFEAVRPMPLDDIWVDIHFLDLEEVQRTALDGSLHESAERRYAERMSQAVSPDFVLESFHGLVALIGDPGIGKTTFLKWVARQLIREPDGRYLLPLVVPLRRYVVSHPEPGGLLSFAIQQCGIRDERQQSLWQNTLGYLAATPYETVLLLLDGWDEVPTGRRESLLQEIQDLSYQFTIVVTSRPSAYPLSLSADRYYEITELSLESITALIERWFQNADRNDLAPALLDHLDAHPDLRRLARNPFLLTVLCGVSYRAGGTADEPLPKTRTELYRQTLDIIRANHNNRYPAQEFNDRRQQQAERLAFWLFAEAPDSPRYVFDSGDVQASCDETSILDEILKPSRLLGHWDFDRESFHFVHTTFHEYLVAREMLRRHPDELDAFFHERGLDAAWQEVFAFVAGDSGIARDAFWRRMCRVAESPDRFGMVFSRLARFVREAGVHDGGKSLLGIDLRAAIWSRIERGLQRKWFISRCADLDIDWYVTQCRQYMDSSDSTVNESLCADLLRSMSELRTFESSRLLIEQLLAEGQGGAVASYAAKSLTAEGIRLLREELANTGHSQTVRRHIIRAVGIAQDYASIPDLKQLAREGDAVLRRAALESLAVIGGIRAFEALDDLLTGASDESFLEQIYAALGEMREARARNRLLDELAERSVDDAAAEAILEALIDNPITKDSAIVADFLMHSPHIEVRESAAWVLATASDKTVADALVSAARDEQEDGEVRRCSLAALRNHARPTDVDWLAECVRDVQCPGPWRVSALEAILSAAFRCRDSSYGPRVRSLAGRLVREVLETVVEDMKLAAAQYSYKLGEDIAPVLEQLCTHPKEPINVREAACQSLGKLKYAPATDTLLKLQRESPLTRVAEAAASALTEIDPLQLLDERTAAADKALADFSLRTGCLVYTDSIIDPRGRRLSPAEENDSPAGTAVAGPLGSSVESGTIQGDVNRSENKGMAKKHIFLSYCHDNAKQIAKLRDAMIAAGEPVWWDQDILPGQDWKLAIRQAMKQSYAVVLCLSGETESRTTSGIYPEAADAIDAYRQYAPGSVFLIPVRLSECEIPPIEIDATRSLDRLQYVDLFPKSKWDDGIRRLVQAIRTAPDYP